MDNQMNTPAKEYPEFFKIFLPEKSSKRMLIPDAFVARLRGRKLPEKAILRRHSGRVWHVYVRNIQGHIYFDDGWKQFVKANSLEAVDFLVFKYGGGNIFKVKIYDKSCCEKKMKEEEEKRDDEDCVMLEMEEEEEEEEEEKEKEKEKEEEEKEEEEEEEDNEDFDDRNVEEEDDEEEDFEDVYVKEEEKEKEGSGNMKNPQRRKGRRRNLSYNAEDYGIDAKIYVQPKNPYFVTTPRRSTRKNELHIPSIIEDYMLSLPGEITLRGPIYDTHGKVRTWQDRRLCISGWRAFCHLNKISGNDICICEFMLETKMMTVHVVRGLL